MKCIPMTRAGRLVAAASSVMEMEEVFVARMASSGSRRSNSCNTAFLRSSLSGTASIAIAHSRSEPASCPAAPRASPRIRPRT